MELIKDQRKNKVNLCMVKKVEETASKHQSFPLALQMNNWFLILHPDYPNIKEVPPWGAQPWNSYWKKEVSVNSCWNCICNKKETWYKEMSEEGNLVLHVLVSLLSYFLTRKRMLTLTWLCWSMAWREIKS